MDKDSFEVSLPNTWPLGHILTDPRKSGNLATGHLVPSGILWDTVSRFVGFTEKSIPLQVCNIQPARSSRVILLALTGF